MKTRISFVLAILCILLCSSIDALSDEMAFKKTKLAVQKGALYEEKDVSLVFTDDERILIRHRKKGDVIYAEILYQAIEEVTYERSTYPRARTATVSTVFEPFAFFHKGKKHWLTIEHKTGDKTDFVLLRLDKNEYQRILATVECKTGIEVERIIE